MNSYKVNNLCMLNILNTGDVHGKVKKNNLEYLHISKGTRSN